VTRRRLILVAAADGVVDVAVVGMVAHITAEHNFSQTAWRLLLRRRQR